jgi:hypothetical protein
MTSPAARGNRSVSTGPDQAELLFEEAQRQGFDRRRSAVLAFYVEVGGDRDTAYDVQRRTRTDGWQASLFTDESGWVVRLCRLGPLRHDGFIRDLTYVRNLARQRHLRLRAVSVDPLHPTGEWHALARQVRDDTGAADARTTGSP